MLQTHRLEKRSSPYPHILIPEILEQPVYDQLLQDFPDEHFRSRSENVMGGRRRIASDEALFYEFIRQTPSWRHLFEYINSPAFAGLVLTLFFDQLKKWNCSIDPVNWRFDPGYFERTLHLSAFFGPCLIGKIANRFSRPNDLYVHFDVSSAHNGYGREIHHDNFERIAAMLIYFSDAAESGGDGGEFNVHSLKQANPAGQHERFPETQDCEVIESFKAQHNFGLMFLSTPNSYHSVPTICGAQDWRKFIYVGLSVKSGEAFSR